jgi:hypothetical protein
MLNVQLPGLLQHLKMIRDMDTLMVSEEILSNIEIVTKELKRIFSITNSSKQFKEFDKKRLKLAKSMATKDGKTFVTEIVDGQESYIFEDKKLFDKEIKALQKEYKEAIDERKKQVKLYQKELDKECKLELSNFQVYVKI